MTSPVILVEAMMTLWFCFIQRFTRPRQFALPGMALLVKQVLEWAAKNLSM